MKNTLDFPIDQLTESYFYDLDPSFIAERPVPGRDGSKLMVFHAESGEIIHAKFNDLANFLTPEHMLILNESKVFPCRLIGEKESGGRLEVLLLSLIHKNNLYPAMIRSNGKKRTGDKYTFGSLEATLEKRTEEGDFLISFNKPESELLPFLESYAQIPIPPYIREGIADESDLTDYQTVYAKDVGSVAAPTAGLHFTPDVFNSLKDKNIEKAFVSLHVGAGTFKPVTSDDINDHKMHTEFYDISKENLDAINKNKKLIAVGTTSLRVLESCWEDSLIKLPESEKPYGTDIFLYPGKKVNSISGLLTNFHLPKSTLLMLVSSLIGREKTLELYEVAKQNNYRFFSYGDAMLILR